MKLSVEKSVLLQGIQTVQGVISSRATLPILSNILVEAYSDRLTLIATDLEIGISCVIPASIHEQGAITIPAKKFIEIIKELPEAMVSLTAMKNNTVSINCEKAFFKLFGLPKEEFPKLPSFNEEDPITLNQGILKNMLTKTAFAVSHDEARYVLNGILFMVKSNSIRLVATDGRRLAMIEKELPGDKIQDKQVIIPAKAVMELNKTLQTSGEVNIIISDSQAMFKLNNTIIITRLIEGEFPNYAQVIPKDSASKVKVNTKEFLTSTRRIGLLTNQDSQSIRIDLLKDKIVISKNSPEVGEGKDEIGVANEARNELSIGFNPNYLLDALKTIGEEEIDFELNGPDKAGVIKTGDSYVYIVLPMQLA